jgi:hypothetical protein|tara:strand:+ start:1909 stop:2148 length:240 start_codon:yes stop_codon:yes gene_type:complete
MKENLKKGIRKKKNKVISMISDSLLIRHKKTRIEYTISKVLFKEGQPVIIAYRYYGKKGKRKRVYIKLDAKEFNKYESV